MKIGNLSVSWNKGKRETKLATEHDISSALENADFPFLVSFPRTGSHWLRVMLELYCERPLLSRSFYDHDNTNYLLYHTHDMELAEQRNNVIYLHRNPPEVIYSLLKYYKQDIEDANLIHFWSMSYASHLMKWLVNAKYISKLTVIPYELMKSDLPQAWIKICDHLSLTYDIDRLNEIKDNVTRDRVASLTQHDKRVVNVEKKYNDERERFMSNYSSIILDHLSASFDRVVGSSEKLNEIFT